MSAVRPLALSAILAAAVVGTASPPTPVADAPGSPKPAPPTAADVAEAIRQLGSGRFAVREKAQQTLWRAGAAAEPALRAALTSDDAEVVRRARAVLDKFDWGIYPDTPPGVLAQVERFRDGDEDAKRQSAGELVRLGPPGIAVLAKLVARADLPDTLVGSGEDAVSNYVALALFSGALPEVIAKWEAAAKAGKSERADDVLAALYRAKGDYASARKHAAENPLLLHDLIWEQGDWKALAALPVGPNADAVTTVAMRVYCFRLAGDDKAAAAEIAAHQKIETPDDWTAVRSVLVIGHPFDPADVLRKRPARRLELFDLLVATMRYKEALAVADAVDEVDMTPSLTFGQAKALYLLGEKDRATQLFAKAANGLTAPNEAYELAKVVRTESGFGLKAAARDHAAGYLGNLARLAVNPQTDPAATVLDAVFPKHGTDAKVWWTFLREKFPGEDAAATMKRVVELLDPPSGAAGPAAFADALMAAQDDDAQSIAARQALAAAHEAAGQYDAARDQLAKAAAVDESGAAGIRLGDFHLARRQFAEAAAAYADVGKRDKSKPLPLALQGWALTKAGRANEGKALLDQAHVLPMGVIVDERPGVLGRAELAEELGKRDAAEPAWRERQMIVKLGWTRAWPQVNFLSHLARDAAARKDYAAAAGAYERLVLGILTSNFPFDAPVYLAIPTLARAHRARAELAAGHVDEALTHARACLDLTPGHMDVALLMVPELEKLGRKDDADALYARAAAPYAALAKDYPHSGHAHNGAAWLAACCHRDLDGALEHARKATELEPKQVGYRDTLAEVHFQRGETATAVKLMRECVAAEPRRAYFGKQLVRFEAGDRTVPPPDEEED